MEVPLPEVVLTSIPALSQQLLQACRTSFEPEQAKPRALRLGGCFDHDGRIAAWVDATDQDAARFLSTGLCTLINYRLESGIRDHNVEAIIETAKR